MISTHSATLNLREDTWFNPRAVIFGVLIFATLLTPVNYRAGSDTSHAHTVFQGMIDRAVGHPHHHGASIENGASSASNLFSPLPIPPLIASAAIDDGNRTGELDPPRQPGMSMPIFAAASVQQLRMLLLALFSAVTIGRLWTGFARLFAVPISVATPPPRVTA